MTLPSERRGTFQPGPVTGFHGTSTEPAARILREGFRPSDNDYDWLGEGVYLFQDAPARARLWGEQRTGGPVAVIRAEIELTDCIDLLDIRWHERLQEAYREYAQAMHDTGQELPRQTPGAHRLDAAVIDYLVDVMDEEGVIVRSVRSAFVEGEPLFPGSALHTLSHVQIAVRDSGIMSMVSEVVA